MLLLVLVLVWVREVFRALKARDQISLSTSQLTRKPCMERKKQDKIRHAVHSEGANILSGVLLSSAQCYHLTIKLDILITSMHNVHDLSRATVDS
jgi:hypothetical protein